jgi:hypothetical protein
LARDECRRLLSSTNIGRLAFCTDAGPRIMPMNYTLVSEAVVLRTSIDSETSHQLFDHPIAFEVDQVDHSFRRDGALLVVGENPTHSRRVIAATRRRLGAAALAGGRTSDGRATVTDDDDWPSSPPVLEER